MWKVEDRYGQQQVAGFYKTFGGRLTYAIVKVIRANIILMMQCTSHNCKKVHAVENVLHAFRSHTASAATEVRAVLLAVAITST